MLLFRRHSSRCSLILLAFAMQAVLALAGTHTHSYAKPAGEGLAKRAMTYGACTVRAGNPCKPSVPHDDHANCPICWSMGLASVAVLALPPAVPLAPSRFESLPPLRRVAELAGGDTVHFQARAPPIA